MKDYTISETLKMARGNGHTNDFYNDTLVELYMKMKSEEVMNREDKPTQKQLDFIRDIEEFGVGTPKFTGTTKQEASEYISKYKNMLELGTMSAWQINYM